MKLFIFSFLLAYGRFFGNFQVFIFKFVLLGLPLIFDMQYLHASLNLKAMDAFNIQAWMVTVSHSSIIIDSNKKVVDAIFHLVYQKIEVFILVSHFAFFILNYK